MKHATLPAVLLLAAAFTVGGCDDETAEVVVEPAEVVEPANGGALAPVPTVPIGPKPTPPAEPDAEPGAVDAAVPATRPADTDGPLDVNEPTGSAGWQPYGQPEVDADAVADSAVAVAVADVIADPDAYAGRELTFVGTVVEVCAARGCWVKLAPAGSESATAGPNVESVFVKMVCDTQGQLVPADAVGRLAVVRGAVQVKEEDVESARHYAQDAGASPDAVAAINEPRKSLRLDAPGLFLAPADAG